MAAAAAEEQLTQEQLIILQENVLAQRIRRAKLQNLQYQRQLLQLQIIKQQVQITSSLAASLMQRTSLHNAHKSADRRLSSRSKQHHCSSSCCEVSSIRL